MKRKARACVDYYGWAIRAQDGSLIYDGGTEAMAWRRRPVIGADERAVRVMLVPVRPAAGRKARKG